MRCRMACARKLAEWQQITFNNKAADLFSTKKNLSNKGILSLHSPSKSSFTVGKLRFFGLREPKTTTCYTDSCKKRGRPMTCWTPSFFYYLF